jgi:hypothetical protein
MPAPSASFSTKIGMDLTKNVKIEEKAGTKNGMFPKIQKTDEGYLPENRRK